MCILRIAQDREAGFFVGQLRPKGVGHANLALGVSARQGMILVRAIQKLMNDHPLVDNVDAKIAGTEDLAIEGERTRIDDDC